MQYSICTTRCHKEVVVVSNLLSFKTVFMKSHTRKRRNNFVIIGLLYSKLTKLVINVRFDFKHAKVPY